MPQIFLAIGQAFAKRILVFGLISLLSLSGLFTFANQPALAEKSLQSQEKIDRADDVNEAAGIQEEERQESYDEAAEAVANPKEGLEKIYEKDLKTYKKENPNDNSLVEGAKNIVDKVTGKVED